VIPSVRPSRGAEWLARWSGILPLLAAELIVWLGFGALLPVLPLYFTDQGLDLATLGLVIAAWPAARLAGEPIFGWLADRTVRVPFMVAGLVATSVFAALPLLLTGPLAFLLLRAGAGLATAVYDPAARGYVADATPPERRGEAFGMYSAAQMGGLLLGPAIGALGAGLFGGIGFVFVFCSATAMVAAIAVALRIRELPVHLPSGPSHEVAEFLPEIPANAERAARDLVADMGVPGGAEAPIRLWNRGLVAALILNAAGYFATGTYEVIWSLFLRGLGASLGLIGLTFAMFGLPILLFSPLAGRLVDRRGPLGFVIAGALATAVAGVLYTFLVDPALAIPLVLIEATGFALLIPALYTVVAASSPRGRSSTAQGIFGAAGTIGFIVASLVSGYLAAIDIHYPFYLFALVMLVSLAVALVLGWPAFRRRPLGTTRAVRVA
jgi:MFS family permease